MIDIWSIKGVREYFPLESDDFHGEMSHLETLENKKIFLYNLSRFPVAHLFPFSGFLPIFFKLLCIHIFFNYKKFQKAKHEFARHQKLFIQYLHCVCVYLQAVALC